MFACTGSRVNMASWGWGGVWFRTQDFWISETPFATRSGGQCANRPNSRHKRISTRWPVSHASETIRVCVDKDAICCYNTAQRYSFNTCLFCDITWIYIVLKKIYATIYLYRLWVVSWLSRYRAGRPVSSRRFFTQLSRFVHFFFAVRVHVYLHLMFIFKGKAEFRAPPPPPPPPKFFKMRFFITILYSVV